MQHSSSDETCETTNSHLNNDDDSGIETTTPTTPVTSMLFCETSHHPRVSYCRPKYTPPRSPLARSLSSNSNEETKRYSLDGTNCFTFTPVQDWILCHCIYRKVRFVMASVLLITGSLKMAWKCLKFTCITQSITLFNEGGSFQQFRDEYCFCLGASLSIVHDGKSFAKITKRAHYIRVLPPKCKYQSSFKYEREKCIVSRIPYRKVSWIK
jgi:hypothetical protein